MKKSSAFIRLTVLICIFFAAAFFSGCNERITEKTSFAMGSLLSAKIYSEETKAGDEIFSLINNAAALADKALSNTDENAEIYILNKEGTVNASDFLKKALSESILLCNRFSQKIDISIGKVTSLWGFNTENPTLPDENDIKAMLSGVDIEKIHLSDSDNKISIEKDIAIDMGALGKGIACDAAYEAIKDKNTSLILSLGGTVFAFGEGPSDGKWTVAVRDPKNNASSFFATLKLKPFESENAFFVSTSGSYEKSFTKNSETYHHILDPETGYPAESELMSVTVVSPSGITADALSTALFIIGLNKEALSYLEEFSAEAVFVFKDKTYYVTDGLKEAFEITASDYTYREYNEN